MSRFLQQEKQLETNVQRYTMKSQISLNTNPLRAPSNAPRLSILALLSAMALPVWHLRVSHGYDLGLVSHGSYRPLTRTSARLRAARAFWLLRLLVRTFAEGKVVDLR